MIQGHTSRTTGLEAIQRCDYAFHQSAPLKAISKYVSSEFNGQNSQSLRSQTYISLVSLRILSFCKRQDPKLFYYKRYDFLKINKLYYLQQYLVRNKIKQKVESHMPTVPTCAQPPQLPISHIAAVHLLKSINLH